jgi:hypothetical protein
LISLLSFLERQLKMTVAAEAVLQGGHNMAATWGTAMIRGTGITLPCDIYA